MADAAGAAVGAVAGTIKVPAEEEDNDEELIVDATAASVANEFFGCRK